MQVTLSEEDARLIAKYVADELIARQPVQMMTMKEKTKPTSGYRTSSRVYEQEQKHY